MWAVVRFLEMDLSSIRMGHEVKVTLVNKPERTFDAKVSLISRNLDSARSAVVHCHLLNPTIELLPGMFANALSAVENKEALAVPEEAVVRWENEQYVFVQKEKGKYEMVPVQVGSTNSGRTEIGPLPADLSGRPMIIKNAYAALMKLQNKAE